MSTRLVGSRQATAIILLTLAAWITGLTLNLNAAQSASFTTNPLITTLAAFTVSLFLFGYGAPAIMFLIGAGNALTLETKLLPTLIAAAAAWLAVYASVRLGQSLLSDLMGGAPLKNALRTSAVIAIAAVLIGTSADIFPELGVPAAGTELTETQTTTLTLQCAADAQLTRSQKYTNHGANPELVLENSETDYSTIILAFDIPQGRVQEAKLVLHLKNFEGQARPSASVYATTEEWDEQSVSWATQPFATPPQAGLMRVENQLGEISANLEGLSAGTRVSLIIRDEGPKKNYTKTFASKESIKSEHRPRLQLSISN